MDLIDDDDERYEDIESVVVKQKRHEKTPSGIKIEEEKQISS